METSNPVREPGITETIVEMARVGGLSDAVYAVALTLLVLDIRLPEDTLASDLPARLLDLAPKLLVYLIGFIIIGGAWGAHQRMLSQIKRGDGPLVWFNLLSLLFVTLVPACAALLGRFPSTIIAIACFAVDVILIQLTAWLLWRHASRQNLINPLLDPRVVTGISRRFSLSGIAFGLSIPLALLSTNLVYAFWLGIFVLLFATDWLSWQQAGRTERAAVPLDGATRANLHILHGAGHLQIKPGENDGDLASGIFGGGLETQCKHEGDTLDVQLRLIERSGFMSWRFPWAWSRANMLDWEIELIREVPISLTVETVGGQADLDLSDLQITNLDLKTSASSTTIRLPANVAYMNAKIEASVASLVIHLPPGVAALIHTNKALSSAELDLSRFIMLSDGREYRTTDYETATHRVELGVELAAGSVKVV